MGASERIPVLLTREQKARLAKRAKAANLTMGEFVRRSCGRGAQDAMRVRLDMRHEGQTRHKQP